MEILLAAVDVDRAQAGFLSYIEKMALKLDAAVWLVHVCQPHPDVVEIKPEDAADWENRSVNADHQCLLAWARALRDRNIRVFPVLMQGPVVESVLEVARDVAASMILVNSHGHGPLYDVLVGSVAEGLSGAAVCPVLWVPAAWANR